MSASDNFIQYLYIERDVKALKMTDETQASIVAALVEDVNSGILTHLCIEREAGATLPVITFRYKDDTTDRTIKEGQYLLIISATGEKRVMTEARFISTYEICNPPVVGEAVVGEATL